MDKYKEALRVLVEYDMVETPCCYMFKDKVLNNAYDELVDETRNYCDNHCGNETEDFMNCLCEFARLVKENEERRNKS